MESTKSLESKLCKLKMACTIAIIGGLTVDLVTVADHLPDKGESLNVNSFSKHLGGKGAVTAVAVFRASHRKPNGVNPAQTTNNDLHKEVHEMNGVGADIQMTSKPELDIQVRMTGAVGADEYGQSSIARLAETGVDISGVRMVEGQATGVSVIIIE